MTSDNAAKNITSDYYAIPEYEISNLIGEGSSSRVYMALKSGSTFVAKIPKDAALNEDQVRIQRREATILARINHPNIAKVIESGEVNGRVYMILEFVQGGSLSNYITKNGFLSESQLIKVAKGLASALKEVHGYNFIHQDIKPDNVLMTESGDPKLIDFNLASHQKKQANSESTLVGTVAYGAPEVLGLLKRPADARSDLYSLGCLLYECATGHRPFVSNNAAEILRCHMNQIPTRVDKLVNSLSPTLGAIISKLLEKDPDDRYQSSEGLLSDLIQIEMQKQNNQILDELSLDSAQISFQKQERYKFVGRMKELDLISALITTSFKTSGKVIWVEGNAGIGKSRLVSETIGRYQHRCQVLSAKAQQGESTPLAAIREAVESLPLKSEHFSEKGREKLNTRIKNAAGKMAPVVGRLSKHLSSILGTEGDLVQLDDKAEQQRFLTALSSFICNLAKLEHGLVIQIDDVQWLDRGSLEVLERIMDSLDDIPMTIICTSRKDTNTSKACAKFSSLPKEVLTHIPLSPLSESESKEFIGNELGGRELDPGVMTQLTKAARGNPFAIIEYLQSILDQGAIRPKENIWVPTDSYKPDFQLPADVMQLLVNRLKSLSPGAYRFVCYAAILGFEFDTEFIKSAIDITQEQFERDLQEIVHANLIEKNGQLHTFTHNRIQEAIVHEVDKTEVKDIHQIFAEAIQLTESPNLYDLARHYALGHPSKHPEKAQKACFQAGVNAFAACSNEQAFELLNMSHEIANSYNLGTDVVFKSRYNLARAALMSGRNSLALDLVGELLKAHVSKTELASIQAIASEAYASMGNLKEAWRKLCLSLGHLGASPPKSLLGNLFAFIFMFIWTLLVISTGWRKGRASPKERVRRELISKIHTPRGLQIAYFFHPVYFAHLIIRERLNVHYLGESPAYAKACVVFSFLPAILGLRRLTHKLAEQAITIAKRLGDPETIAYCEAYACIGIDFSGGNASDHERMFVNDARIAKAVASLCGQWEIVTSIGSSISAYFHRGHNIAHIKHVNNYRSTTHRGDGNGLTTAIDVSYYVSLCLLGRTAEATSLREKLHKEVPENNIYSQTWIWGGEIIRLLDEENLGEEMESSIRKYKKYDFIEYHTRIYLATISLVRLTQMRQAKSDQERRGFEKLLSRSLFKSGLLCRSPVHMCIVWALKGGYAADKGQFSKAEEFLDSAHQLSSMAGSAFGFWLVANERARMAQRQMNREAMREFAKEAFEIADQESWANRKQQIVQNFGTEKSKTSALASSKFGITSSTAHSERVSVSQLRSQRLLDSLLKVAEASTSIHDPIAQALNALRALVKVLDADRGFLFHFDSKAENLQLTAACNSRGDALTGANDYSTKVIRKVLKERKGVVRLGNDKEELKPDSSILIHDLRSIIAAPVHYRDQFLGVVYLDNKNASGVFNEDDLETLGAIANHIAIAQVMGQSAQEEAKRIVFEKEIAVTQSVQTLLLPKIAEHSQKEFKLASTYIPASLSGGDWWSWQLDQELGLLRVIVGDVSGHGAGAAMVTAIAASTIKAQKTIKPHASASETLGFLNDALHDFCSETHMMTMSIVDISLTSRRIEVFSAGAPSVIIFDGDNNPSRILARGEPLGISRDVEYISVAKDYSPGSTLYIYTDGCYEIFDQNKKMLKSKGLAKIIQNRNMEIFEGRIEKIMNSLEVYESDDDKTMVVVELK